MLDILAIIIIIIFSPVALIAGIFSLFIILGIISIPIGLIKKLKEDIKQGDD